MTSRLDLESQLAFGDAEGIMFWFKSHADQHSGYVPKLVQTYKVTPPSTFIQDEGAMYDLIEAMRSGDKGHMSDRLQKWLERHEDLHQAELSAIGDSTPIDLSTVDFRDPSQFYDWMYNHIQVHDVEDGLLV